MATNVLEIDPERLWSTLERSAEIGRFRDVGLRRLAKAAWIVVILHFQFVG